MFTEIKKLITEGKRFLITSHIDPDGDALGSVFSLYWVLKSLSKEPFVYLKDPVHYRYEFLPGPPEILRTIPQDTFDAVFVLDCGELFRVGEGHEALHDLGPLVCIDHHATNAAFGAVNVVDDKASSTCEILYLFYQSMGIELTKDMAVNIYTAVFTDTGSLRYSNAGPMAYNICRRMVETGVDVAFVSQMVYENQPIERFYLLGEVLCTLTTHDSGRVAMAYVTEEMFRKTGTNREHTDGFAEDLRQIRGVEAAIFMRQTGTDKFKISMRAQGTIDVAAVCSRFGGGGHKNAAGCTIEGNIPEVQRKIKEALNIG